MNTESPTIVRSNPVQIFEHFFDLLLYLGYADRPVTIDDIRDHAWDAPAPRIKFYLNGLIKAGYVTRHGSSYSYVATQYTKDILNINQQIKD